MDSLQHQAAPAPEPPRRSLGQTALHGSAFMAAQVVINKVVASVATLLLGDMLTANDFGIAGVAVSIGATCILFQTWVFVDVSIADRGQSHRLLKSTQVGALLFGVMQALLILAVAALAQYALPDKRGLALLIAIIAFRPLSDALSVAPLAQLRISLSFREQAWIDGVTAGLGSAGSVLLAYFGFGPVAIVLPPIATLAARAVAYWRTLPSDPGVSFDREVTLNAQEIEPMLTWGNSPEDAISVTARVPAPADIADPQRRAVVERMLTYMGLTPGMALNEISIDRVFIGSCTNSRIEDLRSAAAVAKGRKVAASVEAWVVPGSGLVKAQAEAEGLDKIFIQAGFQWRFAGCSMCIGVNGDSVASGKRCAATSNRNFVGRQGPGSRTHLMSPATAAASAIMGHLADARAMHNVLA